MAALIDCIVEFLRVRQLNIALAALLTLAYLVYQYRQTIFKLDDNDGLHRRCSSRMSRSKSRSRSRSRALSDMKRRGRKPTRRCPDCSLCNFDE